jgi:hypothetical protein
MPLRHAQPRIYRGTTETTIFYPSAIKALDIYQINSMLVWDCHQSIMQLAKHNSSADMGTGS